MKLFKTNHLLAAYIISILLLSACSPINEVSINKKNKPAETETNWTINLPNGIYLKQSNKQEGMLYIKLKNDKILYSTISVNIDKFNNKYRINIEEKNATQDSEVTGEYFGKIKSKIPINKLEVYLNGKKNKLTIIKN